MAHSIKTVYVVHHSHTDIGYTDLQERVIAIQVNYIKTVLSLMRQPEYADFRWNCETLYCVEEFWKQASEEDRADFARFVKEGKIGISANYLNFNDLVNADVFGKRLAKWQDKLQPFGTKIHTAMAADVNGFSMGYRDAMIENGVEFFFTNVHCHHGMYPLYQNQNAFFWENASGQRLLVWNGEHYNLGNVLGLQPNHAVNWMMRNRLGEDADAGTFFSDQLHTNLDKYLTECETEGYPYDFIVTAVSGVFSDNAPPSAEIMETIRAYNEKYGQEVRVEMVSLQELYAAIAPKLTDAPVYRGDWTDWWANGVGSTPYAVKHYKDADHRWQLANRLDPDAETHYPALAEAVQDNLMLYAEHTWGHSSTITNPYDTMVLNLDMRKNSYASKAHEAASLMLCSIAEKKGDMLRYYNTTGKVHCPAAQIHEEHGRFVLQKPGFGHEGGVALRKNGNFFGGDAVLHALEFEIHGLVAPQQILSELGFVAPKAGQRQTRRNAHRAFGRQAALPDFFCNCCQRQQVVVVIYGLVPLDRLPPRATNKKTPAKL